MPVPYHASDVDRHEPLSAQESHGHDVLFPSLFDDEGHLLWTVVGMQLLTAQGPDKIIALRVREGVHVMERHV